MQFLDGFFNEGKLVSRTKYLELNMHNATKMTCPPPILKLKWKENVVPF